MRIFFFQGLVIAFAGTVLGVAGGLGLCELLSRYQFIELPSNVYPMTTLPIKVLPLDVTIIAISSHRHHPDRDPLSFLEGLPGPARRGAVMMRRCFEAREYPQDLTGTAPTRLTVLKGVNLQTVEPAR